MEGLPEKFDMVAIANKIAKMLFDEGELLKRATQCWEVRDQTGEEADRWKKKAFYWRSTSLLRIIKLIKLLLVEIIIPMTTTL